MKKKGFTLIELLAVILILAIIAVIVTPIISKIIDEAKTQADKRSAEKYAKAAQTFYVQSQVDEYKRSFLGSNIIDKLELENTDATGTVVAYSDGTTEMAIKIGSKCFTKTTTQDIKDIQVSSDIENCVVKSSSVRISNINSGESSIVITIDNSSDSSISITSCKYGTSRGDLTLDGTIEGNVCTLSPTEVGIRYYYELTLSDGSKISGDVQGGTGDATPINSGTINPGGGDHGGGAGAPGGGSSGSGGSSSGSVAGPIFEGENGQVYYTGTYRANVKTIYFDVTNGTKCKALDWQNNGGGTSDGMSSGCLRFYAYMEDNLSYTAILDRNIEAAGKWNSVQWASSGNNGSGPVTAGEKLKTSTANWQGTITPKDYVYVLGSSIYVIPYDTEGYHARFITTDEIAHITGNTNFNPNTTGASGWFYLDGGTSASTGQTWQTQIATSSEKSAYYWLYDYLHDCVSNGCGIQNQSTNYAYWTSDAIAGSSNRAWFINNSGQLGYTIGGWDGITITSDNYNSNGNAIGIRPVITVLKSTVD